MSDDPRTKAAKEYQGHDSNPPRCGICCYFKRVPRDSHVQAVSPNGHVRLIRLRAHPVKNPLIDKCTFGNFIVKPHHVCDKWHGHDGSKIEGQDDE